MVKLKDKKELDKILRHWEEAGEQISLSDRVTHTTRDPFLGQLEKNYILQYLQANQNALEVGCGDALHTLDYAKRVTSLRALDFAESLIKLAKQRARSSGIRNIEFVVGSVLEAGRIFRNNEMDCVTSQRCLISLPSWQYQRDAIQQIHSLLKAGGLFLLTEGFQDELDNLNCLRQAVDLSTIEPVHYNYNLLHSEFDPFVSRYFTIEAVEDYGLYLFLSRVYHPLVLLPEQPKHDSRLNEVASLLSSLVTAPSLKEFSYNLFYALRKK